MTTRIALGILPAFIFATLHAQEPQDSTGEMIEVGKERIELGQTAQARVDEIAKETGEIVEDYTEVLRVTDSLEVYNRLLQKQLDGQNTEIAALKDSISNSTVIERQIAPLLTRMIDDLGHFVELDMPFLLRERRERVEKLRELMERADLTLAEKTRRVFEAFQIENDYGRTIEAYKDELDIDGQSIDVEILRIGRIALVYRDISGEQTGAWNKAEKSWLPVTGSQYRRYMSKGLKIARQEMAPELLPLPLFVNKELR